MLNKTHTFDVTTRSFILNFAGDVVLTLKQVSGDQGIISVQSDDVHAEDLVFEIHPNQIDVKDRVREKRGRWGVHHVSTRLDWSQSLGDTIKHAVKSIITEAIRDNGKAWGPRLLHIEVSLPEVVQELSIHGTQIALANTAFAVETLVIQSNNLELESVKKPLCQHLKIDANNAEIKLIATEVVQLYEIETNCGKVKVQRMPSYQGQISIKGNAVKAKGKCDGDPAKGKIKVRCNAGKLVIKEPEPAN